jgi:hypothetical protein
MGVRAVETITACSMACKVKHVSFLGNGDPSAILRSARVEKRGAIKYL